MLEEKQIREEALHVFSHKLIISTLFHTTISHMSVHGRSRNWRHFIYNPIDYTHESLLISHNWTCLIIGNNNNNTLTDITFGVDSMAEAKRTQTIFSFSFLVDVFFLWSLPLHEIELSLLNREYLRKVVHNATKWTSGSRKIRILMRIPSQRSPVCVDLLNA